MFSLVSSVSFSSVIAQASSYAMVASTSSSDSFLDLPSSFLSFISSFLRSFSSVSSFSPFSPPWHFKYQVKGQKMPQFNQTEEDSRPAVEIDLKGKDLSSFKNKTKFYNSMMMTGTYNYNTIRLWTRFSDFGFMIFNDHPSIFWPQIPTPGILSLHFLPGFLVRASGKIGAKRQKFGFYAPILLLLLYYQIGKEFVYFEEEFLYFGKKIIIL